MEKIIKAAVERGASDLHIKAGDVFRARINGKLVAAHQAAAHARPDPRHRPQAHQQRRGSRPGSTGCATSTARWGMPGVGRFRVNVLRQRSSFMIVMRVIPFTVPTIESLRLPEVAAADRRVGAGPGAGDRRERERQELHRGGDGAPHQPHPAQARRHHRESDRVPPPRPELLHHPARGRGGHREPRGRASARRCGRIPTSWCSARWRTPETIDTAIKARRDRAPGHRHDADAGRRGHDRAGDRDPARGTSARSAGCASREALRAIVSQQLLPGEGREGRGCRPSRCW